jgi:hypothetical protein
MAAIVSGWILIVGYGNGGTPAVMPGVYQTQELCEEAQKKVVTNPAFAAVCVPAAAQ